MNKIEHIVTQNNYNLSNNNNLYSNNIITTLSYYETASNSLLANQQQIPIFNGGCTTFTSLMKVQLPVANSVYQPSYLQLLLLPTLQSEVIVHVCSDPAIVKSLLLAMVAQTNQTVTCAGNSWTVATCSSNHRQAICVNCTNPCLSESSALTSSIVINPCTTATTSDTRSPFFRMMTIGYTALAIPPVILKKSQNVTTTMSVEVMLSLSGPGKVYCAIFPRQSIISSIELIQLQNNYVNIDQSNNNNNNQTSCLFTGLLAATEYTVYFVTQAIDGSTMMTLVSTVANRLNVTTACCQVVTVSVNSFALQPGNMYVNALLVSFPSSSSVTTATLASTASSSTSDSLTVVPIVTSVDNSSLHLPNMVSFIPSRSQYTPSLSAVSSSLSFSFTVLDTASVGAYRISIQLLNSSGSSSYSANKALSKYQVNDDSKIQVLASNSALPAPNMTLVQFANDGSYLQVTFSANTDLGGLSSTFTCASLFSFPCVEIATCYWSSPKTVLIYLASSIATTSNCAKVGSKLTLLKGNVLRAACSSTVCLDSHSTWPTSPSLTLTILAPTSPVLPTVVISAPTILGICTNLIIDVSGSTGSGGRAWRNATISVSSTGNSVANLTAFLSSTQSYTLFPPTAIPYTLLESGVNYVFTITLCNFLGACGLASQRVTILSSSTLPNVIIPGGSLITTTINQAVSFSAVASQTVCSGSSASNNNLWSYIWTVYTASNTIVNGISSISKNPAQFIIPAYSLQVNTFYTISVSAKLVSSSSFSTTTLLAATASVKVYLQQGMIIAKIKGGLTQNVRNGDTLLLDGSQSYDEDKQALTGLAAGLLFSWSCLQIVPTLNESCATVINQAAFNQSASSQIAVLTLNHSNSNLAGYKLQVTLSLQDQLRQRSAQSVVMVTVTDSLAPLISISLLSSSFSDTKSDIMVNTGQIFRAMASINIPSSVASSIIAGNTTWISSGGSGGALADMAIISTSNAIPSGSSSLTSYLVIKSNALTPGITYTFSLHCFLTTALTSSSAASSSSVSITVTVNLPPQSGQFTVSPSSGTELIDPFALVCYSWQDSNLPLSYQFTYLAQASLSSGQQIVIKSLSQASYVPSILFTAGIKESNYSITCLANIYDSYGANNTASQSITVLTQSSSGNSAAFNQSQFVSNALQSMNGSNNVDHIKQTTALVSYLLNKANCSNAPVCSQLNRLPCFTVDHTCGACSSSS